MRITSVLTLLGSAVIVAAVDTALLPGPPPPPGPGGHPTPPPPGPVGNPTPPPPPPQKPKPLVDPSKLIRKVEGRNLLNHANNLVQFSKLSSGTRAFGSKGHNATVAYIKGLLDKTNAYNTYLQTFPYLYSEGSATFSAAGNSYETSWFTYGPAGEVTAPLVPVAGEGCDISNYPAAVAGNIALVMRGTCTFGVKTALAGAAGAAGAIIYNNVDGTIGGGTLGEISLPEVGPYVPVSSLSGEVGKELAATIAAGTEVVATLHVDAVTEIRYSSNIIATTKSGDQNNIIAAGGHTDSVAAGPGINDDGSGAMGLLEAALLLSEYSVKNAVRFTFWTAEEFGLVGSTHYVTSLSDAESQKIALYLNFDMIASPNAGYFILDGDGSAFNNSGPAGSAHIERTFETFFATNKLISASSAFTGRSDYGPFLTAGIPAGGLFTGSDGIMTAQQAKWWPGGVAGQAYDPCYHRACDGISNLNVPFWVWNTKAAAHTIATYALSLKGIPREPRVAAREFSLTKMSYDERRHHACGGEILLL